MFAGVADGVQVGLVGQAAVHDVGAAGVEGAAGRELDQAGGLAGDRDQPLAAGRGAGDGFEQALGVRVVGLVEDVAFGGFLGGPAGVHDHDVVGDVGDDAEVVGDHQQGGAGFLLQPQQQVQDLGLDGGVQGGGGLVGDDQLGVQRDGHRDHGALPHAAGELVRVVVDPFAGAGDADVAEQFDGPFGGGGLGDGLVVGADHLADLPADLVERVQAGQRVLEDDGDVLAADLLHVAGGQVDQVDAVEDGLAGELAAWCQAEQALGQHGLAGAGLAHDPERAAWLDAERDPPHRLHHAVRGREADPQVSYLKQAHQFLPRDAAGDALDGRWHRIGGGSRLKLAGLVIAGRIGVRDVPGADRSLMRMARMAGQMRPGRAR